MKKLLLTLAALLLLPLSAHAGNTVVVGASPTPHAEILAEAAKILKKDGYTLKVVEYSDYVQPNMALDSKELDANYFQHKPYLDDFNAQKGTKLASMGGVHYEPFGIYAGKCKSLKDLKDGAMVAVPNDATNEGRALLLMEAEGLIKLKKDAKLEVHNEYIDIQVLISGVSETFGWSERKDLCQPQSEFNAEKDIQIFDDEPQTYYTLRPGQFTVLFPEDGHAPMVGEGKVRKIIIKVRK